MSIRATAQAAARAAFAAAGDALTTVNVRMLPTVGPYDPETDSSPTTWGFTGTGLRALEFDDVESQQPAAPESRAHSFLLLGEDLKLPDDTPIRGEQEGEITTADGLTWQVVHVETDPTATVWIFSTRR